MNDAESIFLFTQKMLEQASQAYLWEKGIAAYHLGILYLQHQMYEHELLLQILSIHH